VTGPADLPADVPLEERARAARQVIAQGGLDEADRLEPLAVALWPSGDELSGLEPE
jgi:hypothetical protein